jgi:ssDNA-binding Zn-finger/Zn-ribbon topoisomerase 1
MTCTGGGAEPGSGIAVEAREGDIRAECPACGHYVLLAWSREGGRPVARLRVHHEPVQVQCPTCHGTGVTADDVFAKLAGRPAGRGCPACFGNGDLWEVGDDGWIEGWSGF